MSAPMEVCERVLSRVGDRAEAEVTVTSGVEALTRFATGFIHQNVEDATTRIHLRLAVDGRVADGNANQADDAALDRLVASTLEAAAVQPVDPGWPGLTPPSDPPAVDHWDDATASAEPAARAARVADFVSAAGDLESAGFCSTEGLTVAFANTGGHRVSGRTTAATLDGIARTGTSDGSGHVSSARLADLDGAAVGRLAVERARSAADAEDLPPGQYEVVLTPSCVVDILGFLAAYGFNARAVEEGRSFARVGEAQFDPSLTLVDDVAHPQAVGVGFDAEGTPKRRVEVVRDGVTVGLFHDRRTAKALGTESTGNAVPGGAAFGALPANLVVQAGDSTREELIGAVRRGLLVTDFWYTRILDPRTQVVTGLTRNGVWLVEDGRIVRPVTNLRFTQSFHEALAPGRVLGIGSDAALVASATFGFGAYVVPSLHLASWSFTGGAKG